MKEKKSPSLSDSYSSKLKKLNHLNEDSETDDLERQTKRPSVASAGEYTFSVFFCFSFFNVVK